MCGNLIKFIYDLNNLYPSKLFNSINAVFVKIFIYMEKNTKTSEESLCIYYLERKSASFSIFNEIFFFQSKINVLKIQGQLSSSKERQMSCSFGD